MATPPPSQFAALLRRSKFASFDPHIGQVYTAFDGHAARGNFGLKRPLAIRRRNAHITVQAVDSREQQTVWRSAEPENRWIRMWDEVGVKPVMRNTKWVAKLGLTDLEVNFVGDSEFVSPTKQVTRSSESGESEARITEGMEGEDEEEVFKDKPRTPAIPNLDAMSRREFQRYLVRLRELRPAFFKYVVDKRRPANVGGRTLLRLSVDPGEDFKEFLQMHAYDEYHTTRPRYIQQQPHRFGGLSYTHSPNVQLRYTTKPHIARTLIDSNDRAKDYMVVSAGMVSSMSKGNRGDDESPVSTFRFIDANIRELPTTVGPRPQGLEGVKVSTSVLVDSPHTEKLRTNIHVPGSREYVGQEPYQKVTGPVVNMTAPVAPPKQDNFGQTDNLRATKLLQSLSSMTFAQASP